MRSRALWCSCVVLVLALSAFAQDGKPRLEVGLQGTGYFTNSSHGRGVQQSVSENGGFLLDVRYGLNRWLSADVSYSWNRVTNRYVTDRFSTIQSNINLIAGGLVVKIPGSDRFTPYLLVEGGSQIFNPTGAPANVPGARSQAQGTFVYGGGIDYSLAKWLALRAEYRGLVYNAPDFDVRGLNTNTVTHTAEPSAGIVVRF